MSEHEPLSLCCRCSWAGSTSSATRICTSSSRTPRVAPLCARRRRAVRAPRPRVLARAPATRPHGVRPRARATRRRGQPPGAHGGGRRARLRLRRRAGGARRLPPLRRRRPHRCGRRRRWRHRGGRARGGVRRRRARALAGALGAVAAHAPPLPRRCDAAARRRGRVAHACALRAACAAEHGGRAAVDVNGGARAERGRARVRARPPALGAAVPRRRKQES